LSFEFGARHKGGDGVHNNDVDRTAADQHLGNFQCLFTTIGLRYEQVLHIHAELAGVVCIESMFRIDESRRSAEFLRLRYRVQRKSRLTTRLRPKHFDDASAREAADAKRGVERKRP